MNMKINKIKYDINVLYKDVKIPCRYCKYPSEGLYFFDFKLICGNTICPKCKKPITTFIEDGKEEYRQVTEQFLSNLKKIKKSAMYFFKKVVK
ncbi:MAG TPA: hypothetical protein PKL04_00705 [Methanofastidiosum sp.]|nr:hypothetical protein [Methanofastidiosum sp.]